jgi:hypothetical protein
MLMTNASTDKNSRAAIYRAAARQMEKNFDRDLHNGAYWYGACDNIAHVVTGSAVRSDCAEALAFERVFRPKSVYAYWGDEWGCNHDERRNIRILALCFMAAMVEAGDA